MIPAGADAPSTARSIPRESGDDPVSSSRLTASSTVFPARAGMIPQTSPPRAERNSIPRESGDDPYYYPRPGGHIRYSPRERG